MYVTMWKSTEKMVKHGWAISLNLNESYMKNVNTKEEVDNHGGDNEQATFSNYERKDKQDNRWSKSI